MNLFTRTLSKLFKSSNQQELDKIQSLINEINNKESEIKSLLKVISWKKRLSLKKRLKMVL